MTGNDQIDEVVCFILARIDNFIKDNLYSLRGQDLYNFYHRLTELLKDKYFGGSWGFQGIIELLIFRILHYLLLTNDYKTINFTKNLKVFFYPDKRLVLGAGLPLYINGKKLWPDIIIYKSNENDPTKIGSLIAVLEIKAYPNLSDIKKDIERLVAIRKKYSNVKVALIIYGLKAKNKNSKIWRYVRGEIDNIPENINILVLQDSNDQVQGLLREYITSDD